MSENDRDAPGSANLQIRSGLRSPPANLQSRDFQKLELSFIELNKERARQKEWKKLIRDMVFQRGKIPLLLAVEAGNQSMVRELLSAQTAEQLKVRPHKNIHLFDHNYFNICILWMNNSCLTRSFELA